MVTFITAFSRFVCLVLGMLLMACGAPQAPPAASIATSAPKSTPGTSPSQYEDSDERRLLAKNAYRQAESLLAQGDMAAALGFYREAERNMPLPATKYKIAACLDKLGELDEAIVFYRSFLADVANRLEQKKSCGPGGMSCDRLAAAIQDAQRRIEVIQRQMRPKE